MEKAHGVAEASFERYLPPIIYERAEKVLRNQYGGEIGYNPGSQMVQIAGISVLSPLDHFIKEKLKIKWYMRYMDDFILIHPDGAYLEYCMGRIREFLSRYKFQMHPEKSRIYPITDGIKLLGFTHKLTESGKVIRLIDSDNVRSERRKLYRMAQKVKRGEMPKRKVDICYKSWKAHAVNGNTHKLIERMDKYYKSLWEDFEYGNRKEAGRKIA